MIPSIIAINDSLELCQPGNYAGMERTATNVAGRAGRLNGVNERKYA